MKNNSLIIGICLLSGFVLVAQTVQQSKSRKEWEAMKYGSWGGPGVSAKAGPMDTILLKDYAPASSLVTTVTYVPKAKYPAVDAHAHVLARTPAEVKEWVRTMDETGIEKSVVLSGATGEEFDKLVELYLKSYPDRFILFCGLEKNNIDQPDYPERAVKELVRCYKLGAGGVGELSDKGMGFKDNYPEYQKLYESKDGSKSIPNDRRLHPDDKRLDAFWEKCAELRLPVNIHIADHPSCWKPLDIYQERSPDYQHFNQYGKDVPSYDALIAMFERTLQKHPRTTFIACHFCNLGNDLVRLSSMLDKYPNMYLDISARDYEMGRSPRSSKKFLEKYINRCMFGTDMGRVKSMFESWFRLLESEDEYMIGRVGWRYYGLGLSDPALRAIYRDNAKKVIPKAKS